MGKRGPKPKYREFMWTPELAYAIGLMATDGCLYNDGRHMSLTSQDREQLENFMICIGKKVKIGIKRSSYTGKAVTHVQFGDVAFYNFLCSIGLTANKTKTIGALSIPEEYFFDFLRGHHDGDGSFYSYFDPRWKNSYMFYLAFVSASGTHVSWIRETLKNLCDVTGSRVFTGRKGHEIHTIRYAKKETIKILNRMYPNQTSICLSRKRLKIEDALRIVGLSLYDHVQ